MSASTSSPFLAPPNERHDAVGATLESKPMTAAAVVDELGHGLDRIQQHGHDRVDLRLSLEGGGEVSIRLQVRDGAVHASFLTNSAEMREALQQGWSQLSNRSESLGLPLAPPIFETSSRSSTTPGQPDFRERRQEPRQETHPSTPTYAPTPPSKRTAQPSIPKRTTTSGLNAWA